MIPGSGKSSTVALAAISSSRQHFGGGVNPKLNAAVMASVLTILHDGLVVKIVDFYEISLLGAAVRF